MLFTATVTLWSGIGKDKRVTDATNGTVFLLNGNRINGLEVRASTKSKFLYVDSNKDYREKPAYIESGETVATISADINKTYQTLIPSFAFYTDNDSTKATFTRRINVDDIVYVRKDPKNLATKSYVCYMEGSKKRELLCPYSIAQVKQLVDTESLTTV